jgi:Transposase DDE domain
VPIHLEVLRGNRADTTTLQGLLASLQRRFGIEQAIFVFDNGMSSTINLETMRKEALHFVTRLSSTTLRELITQLPQDASLSCGIAPSSWSSAWRANATSLPAESIGKKAISPGARLAWKKPRGNFSAWRPSGAKNPIRGASSKRAKLYCSVLYATLTRQLVTD